MSKRHNAKYKLDRAMGENLWGRPKSPVNKRSYGPGQHGQRRKSKVSDFGLQLRAKQKLKGYYGNITEKQFSKIYVEADRRKGNTSENLISLLESRLDAFVYRTKFVPTVWAARQFVNHGHVLVNGQKVNIASYRLKAGDVVEVRERSRNMALVLEALQSPERDIPEYIELDAKGMKAKLIRLPELAEVPLKTDTTPPSPRDDSPALMVTAPPTAAAGASAPPTAALAAATPFAPAPAAAAAATPFLTPPAAPAAPSPPAAAPATLPEDDDCEAEPGAGAGAGNGIDCYVMISFD